MGWAGAAGVEGVAGAGGGGVEAAAAAADPKVTVTVGEVGTVDSGGAVGGGLWQ
jgi:hypothetical protein